MSNTSPSTPSFVFGYWRPWKENSNLFDSYLDYRRDTSLVKYGADTVGQYINQASKEQVEAINQLGRAIGRGMNVLSNQMSDINETLVFLNRNMDIQVEQQKLSNLLLQNIAELLRVPDSEKERQHCIELGIKFFVNASKDADLYADALEELLKAESLMKQDYFVLHRIGCIYLYVEKYINPSKALEYFLRAAKYASVDSDENALRLLNALTFDSVIEKEKLKLLDQYVYNDFDWNSFPILYNSKCNWYLDRKTNRLFIVYFDEELDGDSYDEEYGLRCEEKDRVYFSDILNDENEEENLKDELRKIQHEIDEILSQFNEKSNGSTSIKILAADSYEKAAFSAYILGKFSEAINYQSKTLNFNETPQNRFLLAKYQVRNGEITEGVRNLSLCIDDEPVLAVATLKEIDLINEPEVINLISSKNQEINNEINKLRVKWEKVESVEASSVIIELAELTQKSYEIKISQFKSFEKKANEINTNVGATESEIDAFIAQITKAKFCTLDGNAIQLLIDELFKAKNLPLEKMTEVFEKIKKQVDADKLKIGSKFAGGVVFYIDKTGKHGLVCAEKDFGKAEWGGAGKIGATGNGIADGSGMRNTKKIVEHASWYIKKGFFSTTKTPAPTAARLCLESNHNGFSDWYLPNAKELKLMYQTLIKNNLGTFKTGFYWSSTEYGSDDAWRFFLCLGDFEAGSYNKDDSNSVRAVRAF